MYLFVYKTTHKNGRFYIGRHQTLILEDGYFGSGRWVNSIKNKSNLHRDILEYTDSIEKLYEIEEKYINLYWKDPLCMNFIKSSIGFSSIDVKNMSGKIEQTLKERYGVSSPLKIPKAKEKFKKTCLKNYGVDHPSKSEQVKLKKKETCLSNLKTEYPMQNEETKRKSENTCIENYGVSNPSQSILVKNKKSQTCLQNYGVDHPSKSEQVKLKKKETSIEKYGVDHPSQLQTTKQKTKDTLTKKYGVDHHNKRKCQCKFCGEFKNILHENFCELNPNKQEMKIKGKSKTFIITSPENEVFKVYGGLEKFCREKNISLYKLKRNKLFGWTISEI